MVRGASLRAIARSGVLCLVVLAGVCAPARGDPNLPLRTSITQYGVTWTFSQAVPVGQFVNGDYYVVGPATITSISPLPVYDSNGTTRNGSVLNLTTNRGYTGFDNRLEAGRYRSSFDAHLPIAIDPGDALVSSISVATVGVLPNMFRPSDHSPDPIQTAAVLTCLAQQVPADTFRPSYLDRNQTRLYRASELQWNLLPSLSLQGVTMRSENFAFTIDSIADMFQRPWLDTIEFGFAAPMQNMPVYGREVARLAGVGTLLLESNYTQAQKTRLLTNMVQVGIDHWGIVQAGYPGWEAFGGHNSGREWLLVFAGMMLGDSNMAHPSKTFPNLKLQEDMQTIYQRGWTGTNVTYAGHYGTDGTGAYGPYEHLWPTQWVSDMNESYRRTSTTVGWIGEALAARILGAQDEWGHPAFFDYVDRWMAEANDATFRQILQDTRGLTYGDYAWEGQTWDPFVMDLWKKYRGYIAPLPASNWYGTAGNWGDANNWPAGEPNASLSACITNGGVATFTTGNRSCSFLAAGGVPGEAGTVNLAGGSLRVGTKVRIGASGAVNLQSGALVWGGADPNKGVPIESDGQFHVAGGTWIVGSVTAIDPNLRRGTTQVDAGASLNVTRLKQDSATVAGKLTIRGASRSTTDLNTLSITGSADHWTGTLDLNQNFFVVRSGNLATITNQIKNGFNGAKGGHWDGNGITSSTARTHAVTAVGVATAGQLGVTTFGDANGLPGSAVLARYTWWGDCNLDGVVDIDNDFTLWKTGYQLGLTGWFWGDFNYDGVVDIDNDFTMWQTGFQLQGTLPSFAEAAFGSAPDAIPEPGTLALLALGGLGMLRGRRRRTTERHKPSVH